MNVTPMVEMIEAHYLSAAPDQRAVAVDDQRGRS